MNDENSDKKAEFQNHQSSLTVSNTPPLSLAPVHSGPPIMTTLDYDEQEPNEDKENTPQPPQLPPTNPILIQSNSASPPLSRRVARSAATTATAKTRSPKKKRSRFGLFLLLDSSHPTTEMTTDNQPERMF